jgi:hypothetical protein
MKTSGCHRVFNFIDVHMHVHERRIGSLACSLRAAAAAAFSCFASKAAIVFATAAAFSRSFRAAVALSRIVFGESELELDLPGLLESLDFFGFLLALLELEDERHRLRLRFLAGLA